MAKIEQVAMTKKLPATTLKLIFIASIKFMGVKNKSGATKMVNTTQRKANGNIDIFSK